MKAITLSQDDSNKWDDDSQDTYRRAQIAAAKALSEEHEGATVEIYHTDGHVVYATV